LVTDYLKYPFLALHIAALKGKIPVVVVLMAYKPDLTKVNNSGMTAIACAYQAGFKDVVAVMNNSASPRIVLLHFQSLLYFRWNIWKKSKYKWRILHRNYFTSSALACCQQTHNQR
jgi:hypothetical protein